MGLTPAPQALRGIRVCTRSRVQGEVAALSLSAWGVGARGVRAGSSGFHGTPAAACLSLAFSHGVRGRPQVGLQLGHRGP